MPGNDPFQSMDEHRTPAEQFQYDRLDREGIDKTQYPAQVDRAAIDVLRNIAVGKTDDPTDIGGTVDRFNFDEATGQYYVDGLIAIAGSDSTLARNLNGYNEQKLGKLAFQLNAFRQTLRDDSASMDIDRALEALLEKTAATAIEESVKSGANDGAGLRSLRDTDSVSDLTARLFSDPRVDAYAQALVDQLPRSTADQEDLIDKLDEARMTTPLWEHQREALERWHKNSQRGYVDMATATGKTVLGLAAIAVRYGALHPSDRSSSSKLRSRDDVPEKADHPRVLIVAGNDLILNQWRKEIDEHLDIPEDRTHPTEQNGRQLIELGWGDIEFRAAQGFSTASNFNKYDLVILDEAHQYTSSSASRGWGALFEDLVDGSNAVLAMSGSVDQGWIGDETMENALDTHLDRCYKFDVAKARREGVIADFSWEVQYLPSTGDQVDRIASQTSITTAGYDSASGTLDTDRLSVSESELPDAVINYDDLRSFVQSNDGSDLRAQSTAFDSFASALLARKPLRWNNSPNTEAIASLVTDHAPSQKTVVLVQSYDAAVALQDVLIEDHSIPPEDIVAFTESSHDRLAKVSQFNDGDRGIIIGPGNLLGVGVDMPDAEVAINVSKGNVNASLVQRIGRILRNPSGNKEAVFYHLVAQPTNDAAIDLTEDGAQLLKQAAEFRALGETFRELPTFHAANTVRETVVDLETHGVELFERVEDEGELVKHSDAFKHVRTVQALVYDAVSSSGESSYSTPVLETWGSDSTESATDVESDQLFADRNESYEQYRLSLGPYRAIKAIITNRYGANVETHSEGDQYTVSIDDESLEGTGLHTELERWLNSYRSWRERCDNRDGNGEIGSLPQYKTEWPEPPADKGTMLPREAVDEIGISYADADPIFFPYIDGELYAVPLPDGQYLTVEGIVDEPVADHLTETEKEPTRGRSVNTMLYFAAKAQTNDFEKMVQDAVASLLKDAIDDELMFDVVPQTGRRTAVDVTLPGRHERLLDGLAASEFEKKSMNDFLDLALYRKLDTGDSTVPVHIDGLLYSALEGAASEDEASIEDLVESTLMDAITEIVDKN